MSTECLKSSLNRADYFTSPGTRLGDRLAVNHSSPIFYSLSHDLSRARAPLSPLARFVFTSAVYWKTIYRRGSVFLINITNYRVELGNVMRERFLRSLSLYRKQISQKRNMIAPAESSGSTRH